MSIESRQDGNPKSRESVPGTGQRSWWRLDRIPLVRDIFSGVWPPRPSHFTHYLIAFLASFATWQGHKPVTIITPFQMPKAGLNFSGEIVADALQDSLSSLHDEIKKESEDPRLRPTEMDLPVLRDLNSPTFSTVQDSTRFEVEVQGVSYQRIVSAARAMWGKETVISGDAVLADKDQFILIARTPDGGPWQSVPSPATADGLKRASRDLAEKILESMDPTLAAAAFLKDGQPDHAVAALDRAQNVNPRDITVKLNKCMGLDASHRYQDAISCYKGLHEMSPRNLEFSARLAHARYLYGQEGNREGAVEDFKKLAQQGYNDALLDLGKALDDKNNDKDHEAAVKVYDEFIGKELRNKNPNVRKLAIANVNKGVALNRLKKHEEARNAYLEALKYAPGDVLILVNVAKETADAGDVNAGIAQLQSLVEENKNSDSVPFALLQLGLLLQEKKDWAGAAKQFSEAAKLRPNYDEAHRRLAFVLAHDGRESDALAEYAKVAKLSASAEDRRHSQVLAYQWLANALRENKKYSDAIGAYKKAIHLRPEYPTAHCELGALLEQQKDLDGAIKEYRAAMAAKPKELDDKGCVHTAHIRHAEALIAQGRKHRAEGIAELQNAMKNDVENDAQNTECLFCLGQAYLDDGNFAKAAAQYNALIKFGNDSPAAHRGLARALRKQGLIAQAAAESKRAADLENKSVARQAAPTTAQLNLEDVVPGKIAEQREHPRCQNGR
jgi:tetratricopeptide (TPR) repeat protein